MLWRESLFPQEGHEDQLDRNNRED